MGVVAENARSIDHRGTTSWMGSSAYGIMVRGSANTLVRGNRMHNCGYGMAFVLGAAGEAAEHARCRTPSSSPASTASTSWGTRRSSRRKPGAAQPSRARDQRRRTSQPPYRARQGPVEAVPREQHVRCAGHCHVATEALRRRPSRSGVIRTMKTADETLLLPTPGWRDPRTHLLDDIWLSRRSRRFCWRSRSRGCSARSTSTLRWPRWGVLAH